MANAFTIQIEGSWTLPLDHIWPDGDGPTKPTAADVARLIEQHCGDVTRLVSDWNLRPEVTVDGERVELY